MIIVAGHLLVAPAQREAYLHVCVPVVQAARATPGCLDFGLSPDLLDPARVNILERWQSREAVETFRGDGPSDDQQAAIREADGAQAVVRDGRAAQDHPSTRGAVARCAAMDLSATGMLDIGVIGQLGGARRRHRLAAATASPATESRFDHRP